MSKKQTITTPLLFLGIHGLSDTVLASVVLLSLFIAAPLLASQATVNNLIQMVSLGLFALSFNILFRYAGLLSFGHAVFFGVAAYGSALWLQASPSAPLIFVLLGTGIVVAVLGLVIGQICVRREGAYFSMTSLAIAAFFATVAAKWTHVTGGADGLDGFLPNNLVLLPFWILNNIGLSQTYWLELAFIIPSGLAALALLTLTPWGNAVRAVRYNEKRAAFLGYNTHAVKLSVFVLSAFLAGIAGGLWAVGNQFVSTDAIDLAMSTNVIIMVVLGGTDWFWGPIIGAMLYISASDWLSALTPNWQLWFGAGFIAVVLFARGGASAIIAWLWVRLTKGWHHD